MVLLILLLRCILYLLTLELKANWNSYTVNRCPETAGTKPSIVGTRGREHRPRTAAHVEHLQASLDIFGGFCLSSVKASTLRSWLLRPCQPWQAITVSGSTTLVVNTCWIISWHLFSLLSQLSCSFFPTQQKHQRFTSRFHPCLLPDISPT